MQQTILLLVLCGCAASKNRNATMNRYEDMEEYDPVKITRCDVVCPGLGDTEHEYCHNRCMSQNFTKPGVCPMSFENVTAFAQACVNVCVDDSQCPLTEKCCQHSCGVTCQPAFGLLANELRSVLPPVPFNITAEQKKGKSAVLVEWRTTSLRHDEVLYLLQERHHFGKFFNQDLLGAWSSFHSTRKHSVLVKNFIKSARWYLFRVAAVNANGTRGFSEPSLAFLLSRDPSRPRRPKKLRVVGVREENGTVSGEVRWNPSRSDVPVQRYKVFWSKRLPGSLPRNESDSVVVHVQSVPQDRLHFQLKNLEKEKLYYVQVQALAVFGRERLKSEKAGMFFNTSKIAEQYEDPPRRKNRKG